MHIDRIPVYRVYQRAIDLELYHAFAELVVQTSQDDTARRTYRQTRAMQIWQVETDVSGYFEPYHLRYPGEVLERFEENWAMMSGFSALWPWRWEIPVRSSLTICLWAISGEHSSRNCGGLPEKMCTCRALCIFWKQMRHSAMPCWRNWQKGSVRERKKPCLYCRYLMIGNAAMR